MPVYVFDRSLGGLVDKRTGERLQSDPSAPVQSPSIQSDYEAFQSPVTGHWIEGRAARREDMKKHGCIDGREFSKPRQLKNKRFIEKHGLHALSER